MKNGDKMNPRDKMICPKAKECGGGSGKIKCGHDKNHAKNSQLFDCHETSKTYSMSICPRCIPSNPPEVKPEYNHEKQFANCKTCKWQADVCCSYESECDGESCYEPRKVSSEVKVCETCEGKGILDDKLNGFNVVCPDCEVKVEKCETCDAIELGIKKHKTPKVSTESGKAVESMYKVLEKYMCSVCPKRDPEFSAQCGMFCDSFRLAREEILRWHTSELSSLKSRVIAEIEEYDESKTFAKDFVKRDIIEIVKKG